MSDMVIDFTTTACCRPEIADQTYASFRDNLRCIKLAHNRLFLNVDRVPYGRDPRAVVEVAQKYFSEVFFHIPTEANFAKAVQWCWLQPQTDFFFHLEDDWILKRPIEIWQLLAPMEANPRISSVNLRAYNFPPEDRRICLSPGLFRTAHARVMAQLLSPTANPERQLRPVNGSNREGGKQGDYMGMQVPKEIILEDIGRPWMVMSGWEKERPIEFTRWVKA